MISSTVLNATLSRRKVNTPVVVVCHIVVVCFFVVVVTCY